ncbi:hypothetical protein CFIO01_01216 [Colletotrichum fioriniae PJ7]|uniref:Uncharacterized protein n=1 Tax=Colletotrichum fioriniae PJ7 TaxID=1445577 RepID=A0A010QW65_9PEZI|nr:hypothetical protein CFIO01_01216 [Colletotrichum fioriniae PJ7]
MATVVNRDWKETLLEGQEDGRKHPKEVGRAEVLTGFHWKLRLLIGIRSSNKRIILKEANAILDHADFDKKDYTTGQQHGGCHWICLMAAGDDELQSDLVSCIANSTIGKAIVEHFGGGLIFYHRM